MFEKIISARLIKVSLLGDNLLKGVKKGAFTQIKGSWLRLRGLRLTRIKSLYHRRNMSVGRKLHCRSSYNEKPYEK